MTLNPPDMTDRTARNRKAPRKATLLLAFAGLALGVGCSVGPDYKRPALDAPAAFKEDSGWTVAAPDDGTRRGPWWEGFGDPVLNQLEVQVETSNQTVLQALANYEAARQVAHSDRTGYLPAVSVNGSATRSRSPSSSITTT